MNYKELFEKYQSLLIENNNLKDEIKSLKTQFGINECQANCDVVLNQEALIESSIQDLSEEEPVDNLSNSEVNNKSKPHEKIELYMSLFKGREDVYAKRWVSPKKGTAGYSPFCINEWRHGICRKPKGNCNDCTHKEYAPLNEKVIDMHLRGIDSKGNSFVAGIYPLCQDETCWFLAIDFDKGEWQKEITVLREVCVEFNIPLAVERSRSGNGAHAWFFFKHPLSAMQARKFGSALITHCMTKRHEIPFKSYDRLFPNQDTMPKGGLGNLIALPFQKAARNDKNSVFIDENFVAIDDQWAFLDSIKTLSEDEVDTYTCKLCSGNELGTLKKDDEETQKPWEVSRVELSNNDYPDTIHITKANMLYIEKSGISQRALNQLKRLAAFKNPEFYKAQAMRLPTRNKPMIISCSEETIEYLCLPRGCENDLKALINKFKVSVDFADESNKGKSIDIEFNGTLRDEQPKAIEKLLEYENGILCGTTAFGKTVVAIKLIAERKVNTLILVDKVSLVSQWKNRIMEFLTINECLPDSIEGKNKGRKKTKSIIGQLGAGKDNLSGVIDIAVMQSLNRMGEVKDCIKNYGMIIVDECHHVSAFSFEKVLKSANAKYVYGLTATPTRKDGHHPIIFMQCGPIRYRDDAKKQAEKRPFEHYIIPRFTSLRVPLDKDERDVSINDLYAEIVTNEMRNNQIVEDVIKSHKMGRNCVVLTERTAHVEWFSKNLSKYISDVITLTGGMGTKETREVMKRIAETPIEKNLTLVATGRYIGEGFDEPRLDTLFLAMPISWKGTLQQYAGRLHRLFEGKNEVQIYDYVDIHVRMLEKMYNKRLTGYASIGYKAKGEIDRTDLINVIFDKSNFLPVYTNDIESAEREIIIVSPFVTKKRSLQMLKVLESVLSNKVKVIIVTRPIEDFQSKDITSLRETLETLKAAGISMVYKPNIHQKFAVMDQKIVWYGSINLMSFGSAEESIMRLESYNIANELIKNIES